ncbi:MAG TPA: hypothetical protein VFV97_06150, partial [Rhodanobacteraceae bacterium]|nr:hypothetical protein [Rhodanobacteraceae bacterium]
TQGTGRMFKQGDAPRVTRARVAYVAFSMLATCSIVAAASNPLAAIGETFSDWKDRLFGKPKPVVEAPAEGAIAMTPDHPTRLRIDKAAPERDFPKGKSRYRIIDLPEDLDHAAVRVQVTAMPREHAFGHEVFKPFLYTLNADDTVRDTIEVKPLHLDIRPFKRTRLLGCATLDKVGRFAVATEPDIVGKSYESEVRDAIKAPTQGGFYYATDAVKVKLPYADTGELTLEVTKEPAPGKGC